MSRIARVMVPNLLLLSLLAGCGGDDQPSASRSPEEQTAADNLAAQIVRTGDVSGESAQKDAVTADQAQCIGEGAVDEVGLTRLQHYGILTKGLKVNKGIQGVKLSRKDARALAGVFVECIDAEALFEKQLLRTLPKSERRKARGCVRKAVDTGSVRAVLSASFQRKDARAYDRLRHKVSACTGGKG